jgi:hypothetical protein
MSLSNPIHSVDTVDGTVRVVMDRHKATVTVLHTAETDELAQFSFQSGQEGSLSQKEASYRGIEYANGYAHAYDNKVGGS